VFPGIGTLVNALTVLVGSGIGVAVGHRLPHRTRDLVTDALGLVTLLIAASSATAVGDPALDAAVGRSAPVLIVLGSLVLGGVVGSALRVEDRLEGFGGWLRSRLRRKRVAAGSGTTADAGTSAGAGTPAGAGTAAEVQTDGDRFIEGFVTASLLFCVGPLTVLGAISDGLGNGADQLFLKAALDGFAAIAFAASFGWGVAASAVTVVLVQGALTVVGVVLGSVLDVAQISALEATGGLVLVGVALGLLRLRRIPVGDLLPALVVAPLLTAAVAAFR
jgi:uncharacterized membrane protein YqgA involved in biofilm formation